APARPRSRPAPARRDFSYRGSDQRDIDSPVPHRTLQPVSAMSTSTDATPLDPQIDAVAAEIEAAPLTTPDEAEAFRIRFLGRKSGAVTDLFGRMGQAPPEQRRALGQRLNALKARAQARL